MTDAQCIIIYKVSRIAVILFSTQIALYKKGYYLENQYKFVSTWKPNSSPAFHLTESDYLRISLSLPLYTPMCIPFLNPKHCLPCNHTKHFHHETQLFIFYKNFVCFSPHERMSGNALFCHHYTNFHQIMQQNLLCCLKQAQTFCQPFLKLLSFTSCLVTNLKKSLYIKF